MNKTLLSAALIAGFGVAALAPQAARAADGTINITGKVISGTCTVAVNGANANVVLPNVQASALTAGSAYTTGAKGFSVALTGCPASPTGLSIGLGFQTTNADTATGTLKNTGVTNMDVQLMYTTSATGTATAPATTGGTAVVLDGATVTGAVNMGAGPATSAYYNFYAMYYPLAAWSATTGTGAVSTSAQFNVSYQ
ncbi:hypothetical protein B0E46_03735 [Rhodanobacter sp. B04]|uniref:fimbrial protein n=1 Tax=Rhodanobacter sp. B04 TaxID=1945860 RepID=UPI000985FCF4|nr:fimbrial protein [Rhodanobacter sp. B04]OOG65466.1 hypothetical protein B0E46_03735 [Rhodanobacter sp. B04]